MTKKAILLPLTCFLVQLSSLYAYSQVHGPRAGQISRTGEFIIEVVARDQKGFSIFLLEQNWGDKNLSGYVISASLIGGKKPTPLSCAAKDGGIYCKLPENQPSDTQQLSIEISQKKKLLGRVTYPFPLRQVSELVKNPQS